VTKCFTHPGGDLYVNADASRGSLTAEFLDQDGKSLAPIVRSEPLTRDALAWRFAFRDVPAGALAGKPVRLRFVLDHARFFSFWFQESL
jgi:hypothetical protein